MAILAKEDTEGQPDQTDADGAAKEGSSDIEGESEKEQGERPHDCRKRMVTYMNSLDRGNTPFLNELEQEAISKSCAHYPKRNAELFKGAFADKGAKAYFRSRNRSRVFHPSYEYLQSGKM